MSLLADIILRLVLVVITAIILGLVFIVRPNGLPRDVSTWYNRIVAVLPELTILGSILAINSYARQYGPEVSWVIGWEITDSIYQLEGGLIIWIQGFATPPVTTYFSRIYVYGYVFLLVFPIIAYLALSDSRPVRTLLLAYGLNYLIGLMIYTITIAYGPRNLLPELVEPLMYTTFPEYQELTRQVNRRTNVFPSLHTSLSVTVLLMAYLTRDRYPRWLLVAAIIGVSVVISTMYLGIHWATDVLAGVLLAFVSVAIASYLINTWGGDTFLPEAIYRKLTR